MRVRQWRVGHTVNSEQYFTTSPASPSSHVVSDSLSDVLDLCYTHALLTAENQTEICT